MYLCEHCQQQIAANTPTYLFPVQSRISTYPKRQKANRRHVKHRLEYYDDNGGKGVEVVKELRICPSCYQELSKAS